MIATTIQKINKKDILLKFVEDNKHLAVQGTEEWKADRMYSIGGSEISTIMGLNPFNSKINIIAQKISLSHFNGISATRWGNLFEGVSERLFKILFLDNSEIYNIGSIPHKTIKEHRYSPDGLCIMTLQGQEKIVLLEFKSPYSSVPTAKVPKHYLPQVKAGLCTIDIADTCIFINNMFRKCSLKQLDFSIDYDTRYHRDKEPKLKNINSTIANGIIFLYIDKYKISEFTRQYDEFIRLNHPINNDSNSNDNSSDDDCIIYNNYNYHDCDSDRNSNDSDIFDNDLTKNTYYDNGQQLFYKIYPNLYAYNTKDYESYKENMIDFGDKKEMFNQMLKLYKADNEHHSIITPKYMKPQINKNIKNNKAFIIPQELEYAKSTSHLDKICKQYDIQKCINRFIKQCIKNGNIPIGYLPWKLFRSSNIIVDKDTQFLENIKDDITNTIEIIKHILSNAITDHEKAILLNTYFENNDISKKIIEKAETDYSYFIL